MMPLGCQEGKQLALTTQVHLKLFNRVPHHHKWSFSCLHFENADMKNLKMVADNHTGELRIVSGTLVLNLVTNT